MALVNGHPPNGERQATTITLNAPTLTPGLALGFSIRAIADNENHEFGTSRKAGVKR